MKINRENYEEYFILYADNELKLAERKMVEDFVAIHTDLKEEFDLMLQMKLDPEDRMSFPDKSSLFKPMELQDDQYQPEPGQLDMLLYMDNELEEEARLAFEQKLKTDKKVREEFDIFLNARAEPDFKVVFPDKSLLYRHTEKSTPIIRITWVRVAVAAAVILIAGLLWLNGGDSGNDQSTAPVASVENGTKEDSKKTELPESPKTDANDDSKTLANNQPKENESLAEANTPAQKRDAGRSSANRNRKGDSENIAKIKKVVDEKPSNNLAVNKLSIQDPAVKNSTTPEAVIYRPEVKDKKEVNSATDIATTSRPDIIDRPAVNSAAGYASASNIKTNYATDALLRGDDETEEKTAQLIEEEKPRKGALRGFFRKANRVLNRVTDPDQGPASVRVAGFEIASAQ